MAESGVVYCGVVLVLLVVMVEKVLNMFWWNPRKMKRYFMEQGITGPPSVPFIGSLGDLAKMYAKTTPPPSPSPSFPHHSVLQHVFPQLHAWRNLYGGAFLYFYGRFPRLQITDPELIKEFTMAPRKFSQSIQHPLVHNLLGKGIVASGGDSWASQRRILSPYFFMESLKGVSAVAHNVAEEMIQRWNHELMGSDEVEIEVLRQFELVSQCIVAKMLFGNDAEQALPILQMQAEQSAISSKSVKSFYIPGFKFIPSSLNRRSRWLRRETERQFNELIEKRQRDTDDWLALMLSSNTMSRQQIIDECCTFMIAGSESSNLLLAWACFLLSVHTEWQVRAQGEIHEVLKGQRPTLETINQLKILNMIIHETLRLYPPIPFVMKTGNEEMKIGNLTIPAGVDVEMPIISVHHDPKQWGENFDRFEPSRFAEGVSKSSKHPMAYMPFMLGPRICLGMNFAMIEAKIVLATVLQNFAFVISPAYKHDMVFGLSLRPKYGIPLLFHKL
ncbi:putative cytochrome P450 [Dioscorea sansibarensis]